MSEEIMDAPPPFNPPPEDEQPQDDDLEEEAEMTPHQRAVAQRLNDETTFWEDMLQMSLTPQVRARLATEGLTFVADFVDFKSDQVQEAFKNMRSAIPGVPGVPQVMDAQGRI